MRLAGKFLKFKNGSIKFTRYSPSGTTVEILSEDIKWKLPGGNWELAPVSDLVGLTLLYANEPHAGYIISPWDGKCYVHTRWWYETGV